MTSSKKYIKYLLIFDNIIFVSIKVCDSLKDLPDDQLELMLQQKWRMVYIAWSVIPEVVNSIIRTDWSPVTVWCDSRLLYNMKRWWWGEREGRFLPGICIKWCTSCDWEPSSLSSEQWNNGRNRWIKVKFTFKPELTK